MKTLDPGTYADLKHKRRLVVALPRCKVCGPFQIIPGDNHVTRQHNERCARTGERVYRVRSEVGSEVRRAA
jgi:hypothetical protein